MFGETLLQVSGHPRTGLGQWISESVATFGLVLLVLRRAHCAPGHLPWLIGAYIAAAYWFTASTAFANPAVTLARAFTDTFAGIRLADAPAFFAAQIVGSVTAFIFDIFAAREEADRAG
jgi:glycerol uptake facilitator-like aquaporin